MSTAIQERPVHLELRPNATNSGLMLESVTIKNFRCFKDAKAEKLGLVNVIVGDMASGKSAFLEALFLLATNSPAAHETFYRWRGRGNFIGNQMQVVIASDDIGTAKYWEDLFHGHDTSNAIKIEATGAPVRKVCVTVDKAVVWTSPPDTPVEAPILFEWWDGDQHWESRPLFDGNNLKAVPAGKPLQGIMLGHSPPSDTEVAHLFSELKAEGKVGAVVSALASWIPEIKDLSILLDGNRPVVFVVSKSGNAFPLTMLSHGLNKLVYVMCAIKRYPGGPVFIDEVGAGIYHSRLQEWWQILYDLADESGTQLFLTTHSAEALNALQPTIGKHENQFRLIRAVRDSEQGLSTLKVVSGAGLSAAIKENMEVR